MRCQYCGREAQPGQVYCECGHPVSLSQGADPRASSFGFDEPPSDYDRNWYTPDGRSLSSLEKKGMGAGGKIVIMLIVIMALAAGAFFAYKFITQSKDLLDEDNWEKKSFSKGSITLPSAMKESDNIIELSKDYTKLAFFTSDNAAVYLLEYKMPADKMEYMKTPEGLNAIKQNLITYNKRRKINNYQLDPKQHGELICFEYPSTKKNYIKSTSELWVVNASLVTPNGLYEMEAYCPKAEKDKYLDAMYKWLESFKPY